MSTVIIGSSNVDRFYKEVDKSLVGDTRYDRCTKYETFGALMDNITEKVKIVIITVVENFLSDAVGGERNEEEMARTIDGKMNEFLEVVETTAKRLPRTTFGMVEPMRRPGLPWYEAKIEQIVEFHNRLISAMKMKNVGRIAGLMAGTQVFDSFGIHLVPEAGLKFVEMIILNADDLVESLACEVIDEEMEDVESNTSKPVLKKREEDVTVLKEIIPLTASGDRRMKTTDERLDELEADIETRRFNDNIVFARIREEQDYQMNEKKEDRIFLTGLTTNVAKPAGEPEIRKWVHDIVVRELNKIIPDSGEMIQFISQSRSHGGVVPTCEVKMKEKDLAVKLRKTFGQMRKAGKVEGRVFMTNCVTMGTRVRLEIMRAIARKCCSPNEDMFVMGFSSRPVLQIKRKDDGSKRALTFVDAVIKYGKNLRKGDLGFAYERAGESFSGQMSQNFVVLTDDNVIAAGPRGSGKPVAPRLTGGNKRGLDKDDGQNSLSKRPASKKVGFSKGGDGKVGRTLPVKKTD